MLESCVVSQFLFQNQISVRRYSSQIHMLCMQFPNVEGLPTFTLLGFDKESTVSVKLTIEFEDNMHHWKCNSSCVGGQMIRDGVQY